MKKDNNCIHPGEYLEEEIQERGWTLDWFAQQLDIPRSEIDRIIVGEQDVTPRIAKRLAEVLGTSVDLWTNLQTSYDVCKRGRISVANIKNYFSRGISNFTELIPDLLDNEKYLEAAVINSRIAALNRLKQIYFAHCMDGELQLRSFFDVLKAVIIDENQKYKEAKKLNNISRSIETMTFQEELAKTLAVLLCLDDNDPKIHEVFSLSNYMTPSTLVIDNEW